MRLCSVENGVKKDTEFVSDSYEGSETHDRNIMHAEDVRSAEGRECTDKKKKR